MSSYSLAFSCAFSYALSLLPFSVKLRPAEKLLFNLGSDLCNQWLHQRKIKKTMHEAFIDAKKRCSRDFREVFQVTTLVFLQWRARETDTGRARYTHRPSETNRQRERHTDKQREAHTEEKHRRTDRQSDRQSEGHGQIAQGTRTNRHTDRGKDGQTETQTDIARDSDRHT